MSSYEAIDEAYDEYRTSETLNLDTEEAVIMASCGDSATQLVRYVRWKKQLLETDPSAYIDRVALINAMPGLSREEMTRLDQINSTFKG